ncbi:hypothetical protein VDIAB_240065 [Vibrio diabolicus]|nr:hypothetical protein VDIAB_240065 [Vibrio diabolicus]
MLRDYPIAERPHFLIEYIIGNPWLAKENVDLSVLMKMIR